MDIDQILKNCDELKDYIERACRPDESGTRFFKEIDFKNYLNHMFFLQCLRTNYMGHCLENWDSADIFLKKYKQNINYILKDQDCKGEIKLWLKTLLKRDTIEIEKTLQELKADLIYKEEINEY